MLNVAFPLDATARRRPGATAVVHENRRYSFLQIARMANRVAGGLLASGLGRGDRIALCCSNRAGFVIAYYGILKIGATAVVLSAGLKRRDLLRHLRDCAPRAFLCFDGHNDNSFAQTAVEVLREIEHCEKVWIIPPDPTGPSTVEGYPSLADLMLLGKDDFPTVGCDRDDTAAVLYTSGTTGRPKGSQLTHANLSMMVMTNLLLADRDTGRVRLVINPLFSVMGQILGLNMAALCGDTMVLLERFDPERAWELVAREGVTFMAVMPVLYRHLLDHARPRDETAARRTLKICATGGAPLPPEWAQEFRERLGVPILPGYGMTETTSTVAWTCPFDEPRPDSVGRPIPGVSVRLIDENDCLVDPGEDGQIIVRSPGLMKGYLGMSQATAGAIRGGWFYTGDSGAFDEAGFLYIRGRLDDKIKRGDEHVYPAEIEAVLHEHPLVSQAAVVPRPDRVLGQEAVAFVVLKPGAEITEARLLAWLDRELPEGKCPGIVQFLSSLPVSETGKVARQLLPLCQTTQLPGPARARPPAQRSVTPVREPEERGIGR